MRRLASSWLKRLIEQQDVRLGDERARQGDALLLAAGQLAWPALLHAGQPDELHHVADAATSRVCPSTPRMRRPKATLSPMDMCGKSSGFWKTMATLRLSAGMSTTDRPSKRTSPAVGLEQARQHLHRRRLAAAGRSQEGHQLAALGCSCDAVDAGVVVLLVDLRQRDEVDRDGHARPEPADGRPRRRRGSAM